MCFLPLTAFNGKNPTTLPVVCKNIQYFSVTDSLTYRCRNRAQCRDVETTSGELKSMDLTCQAGLNQNKPIFLRGEFTFVLFTQYCPCSLLKKNASWLFQEQSFINSFLTIWSWGTAVKSTSAEIYDDKISRIPGLNIHEPVLLLKHVTEYLPWNLKGRSHEVLWLRFFFISNNLTRPD
jgi:hypothetical protein